MRTLLILLLAALPLSAQEASKNQAADSRIAEWMKRKITTRKPTARQTERASTSELPPPWMAMGLDKKTRKRAEKVCAQNPSWDARTCVSVAEKKVYIGMTAEQARAAWGRPHEVNRTVYSFGTHEQWVYSSYGSYRNHAYLYFENGVLTTIQQENL